MNPISSLRSPLDLTSSHFVASKSLQLENELLKKMLVEQLQTINQQKQQIEQLLQSSQSSQQQPTPQPENDDELSEDDEFTFKPIFISKHRKVAQNDEKISTKRHRSSCSFDTQQPSSKKSPSPVAQIAQISQVAQISEETPVQATTIIPTPTATSDNLFSLHPSANFVFQCIPSHQVHLYKNINNYFLLTQEQINQKVQEAIQAISSCNTRIIGTSVFHYKFMNQNGVQEDQQIALMYLASQDSKFVGGFAVATDVCSFILNGNQHNSARLLQHGKSNQDYFKFNNVILVNGYHKQANLLTFTGLQNIHTYKSHMSVQQEQYVKFIQQYLAPHLCLYEC